MIKKLLLFVLLFGVSAFLFAQDVIVKTDGSEIKTKVIAITDSTIEYKPTDVPNETIISILKTDVFMIIFEDGSRQYFSKLKDLILKKTDYNGRYFLVGAGFGRSYGGLGFNAQYRIGGEVGFGAYIGVGYYSGTLGGNKQVPFSEGKPGFVMGVKFYPYKGFYLSSQAGVTGVEYNYYKISYTSNDLRTLWGGAALIGNEFILIEKVGFGFNAAIGSAFNFNSKYKTISLVVDLGFIVRF